MKSLKFIVGVVLIIMLSGCDTLFYEGPPDIESVSVHESTLDSVYVRDTFDIDSIKLMVSYRDGTQSLKSIQHAWLTPQSEALLRETGEHTLEVTYEEFGETHAVSFDVVLVEDTEELIIYRIHQLGLETDEIVDGYEAWKASIQGEDGIDGDDGRSIELEQYGDVIRWRYDDEAQWRELIHIDELIPDGEANPIARIDEAKRGTIGVAVTREEGEGSGSGMIYKQEGDTYYMVTNYHVVEDAIDVEIVYSINGNLFFIDESITKIGYYAEADIAVYSFESDHDLEALDFADERPLIGEEVYAIGHGGGFNAFNTVTRGIASKHHVWVTLDDVDAYFLQHDAAINPGNSGGPLINDKGEIVGMNSIKIVASQVDGVGYALPASIMERMIEELEDTGSITRGEIGIMTDALDACGVLSGVCIGEVREDTTADAMELREGDVITGIKTQTMDDFKDVQNTPQLIEWLYATRAEQPLQIRYERNGDESFTSWELFLPRQ